MLLGHSTNPRIENYYKILKSGYLKSGKVTGERRLIGDSPLSKYIFLALLKPGYKPVIFPQFELNIDLLLDNSFYIRQGWGGPTIYKSNIKINGKKLSKKELKTILKDEIILSLYGTQNHEILVTKKINLKKYLTSVIIYKNIKKDKEYKEFVHYIKTEYPNVKLISYSKIISKY